MARVKEIVCVDTAFEAHRLVSILDEVGIEAEVEGENTGTMFGAPLGFEIRVLVAEADGGRAAAALAELAPPSHDDDEAEAAAEAEDEDDEHDEDDEDGGEGDLGPRAEHAGSAPAPMGAAPAPSASARPATSAADAGPARDGSEGPRDAAADPTAPWPAAKAERWARQLFNLSIGSLLFLGVFPPIGIVMLVYVAVKCVDPPLGVNDVPRARRSLRWARVAVGIGGLLLVAIGFSRSWGLALGIT